MKWLSFVYLPNLRAGVADFLAVFFLRQRTLQILSPLVAFPHLLFPCIRPRRYWTHLFSSFVCWFIVVPGQFTPDACTMFQAALWRDLETKLFVGKAYLEQIVAAFHSINSCNYNDKRIRRSLSSKGVLYETHDFSSRQAKDLTLYALYFICFKC